MWNSSEGPSGQSTEPVRRLRALIDTNVLLDWLIDRQPWADMAQSMWNARDAGTLLAYLPASVLTDIFYIVRRHVDIPTAFAAIDRIFAACEMLIVDAPLLRQARALQGNDFEDNVQIACAMNAQLDLIITRNPSDFRTSPIKVIAPSEFDTYLSSLLSS